jgi:hypothetical protein
MGEIYENAVEMGSGAMIYCWHSKVDRRNTQIHIHTDSKMIS